MDVEAEMLFQLWLFLTSGRQGVFRQIKTLILSEFVQHFFEEYTQDERVQKLQQEQTLTKFLACQIVKEQRKILLFNETVIHWSIYVCNYFSKQVPFHQHFLRLRNLHESWWKVVVAFNRDFLATVIIKNEHWTNSSKSWVSRSV